MYDSGCDICGGDLGILGVLGRMVHLLCRDCGAHSHRSQGADDICCHTEEDETDDVC